MTVATAARRVSRERLGQPPPRQFNFAHLIRQGWVVIRRGAATSAVKAIAEFGQDNLETNGNEIDTNILVAIVECLPVRLRKLGGAGLSAFPANEAFGRIARSRKLSDEMARKLVREVDLLEARFSTR